MRKGLSGQYGEDGQEVYIFHNLQIYLRNKSYTREERRKLYEF